MTSIPSSSTPHVTHSENLWRLDGTGVPPETEKNLPHEAILKMDFERKLDDLSKRTLAHLVKTDLSQVPMTKKAWGIYEALLRGNPEMFSLDSANKVKLIINGQEFLVSKNNLAMLSEKFRWLFSTSNKETKENKIILEVPPNLQNSFVQYLTLRKEDITPENAYAIFALACEHGLEDLKFKARRFIEENLDDETALVLLKDALEMDFPELLAIGLQFAWKHKLPKPEAGELRFFLQAIEILKEKKLELSSHGNHLRIFSVDSEVLYNINYLCSKVPAIVLLVRGADISIDNQGLESIITRLPALKNLVIAQQATITHIPYPEQFQLISLHECPLVTELDAPNALEVVCLKDVGLIKINAPRATYILCAQLPNMEALNIPNVRKIILNSCDKIKTLSAQEVREFYGINCAALQTLLLSNGVHVGATNFAGLRTLTAPNAMLLDIEGSFGITQLIAHPHAKIIGPEQGPGL